MSPIKITLSSWKCYSKTKNEIFLKLLEPYVFERSKLMLTSHMSNNFLYFHERVSLNWP